MASDVEPRLTRPRHATEPTPTFPCLENEWDITSALEALTHCGLAAPTDINLRNGLLLALSHESYIYENAMQMPGATPGLLEALSSLGSAFLARAAAVHLYRQKAFDRPGPLSERIGHIASSLPDWAGRLEWLRDSAAISKGLHREALPRRVPATLCKQILGVLCLAGRDDVAAALIAELFARSGAELESSTADPRTRLQGVLGRTVLDTRIERTGPDHAPRFQATLTDSRGRRSTGEGASKKEAVRIASANFLRRYMPHGLAQDTARVRTDGVQAAPLPVEGPAFGWHVNAVQRLRQLFQLPVAASALLSQALIHSSWTYEHKELTARTLQQDNQVLGLVGSHVLTYEYALRAIRIVCQDPPKQFAFLTLDREPCERGFYHTGLANALLQGTGQASIGLTAEMAANAFQATIAAVYLSKECPASLLEDWPPELSRLRDIVVPRESRSQDSITLLQETCSAAQLTADYSFEVSGPQHQERFRATLTLCSQVLSREIKLFSHSVPGGKTAAKKEVATAVLEVLDALAEPESLVRLVESRGDDVQISVFLLAHLAAVLPSAETLTGRWVKAALFGTHLARTPAALAEWAHQADQLLRRQSLVQADSAAMTDVFRSAIAIIADQTNPARQQLVAALDWLDGLDGPEQIEKGQVSRLMQLCDLYRALGSDEPDVDLRTLVEDWQLLYGGRIGVTTAGSSPVFDGLQRAVIDAIATLLLKYSKNIEVCVDAGFPLRIRFISNPSAPREELAEICALWSAASPLLSLTPIDGGVDAVLTVVSSATQAGPVTCAVAAALRPSPAPYSGAVADLLHDLKNQLVAAKQALAAPAPNRTALLSQQAAASSHLDQAIAIGRRLGAVSSLLGPPGSETTEVGSFMRRYSAALLGRLPASVSLAVPPSAGEAVTLALDEPSLTAILDNLIKNAIEAMPGGGALKLDWTSDEQDAVLEVADDGPGLPEHVIRAVQRGGRVTSTRTGGNGLGLLSVQTLLRRAGGDLTAASSPSGTAWLLSIPIAATVGGLETR